MLVTVCGAQHHGCGAMVYSQSSSYDGDWVNGLRHGKGEFIVGEGTVYRGDWLNDKFSGKGTLTISYINYNYTGKLVIMSVKQNMFICCVHVY